MYKIINSSSQVIPLTLEVGSIVMRPSQSFDLELHCSREFIKGSAELAHYIKVGHIGVLHDSAATIGNVSTKSPFPAKNFGDVHLISEVRPIQVHTKDNKVVHGPSVPPTKAVRPHEAKPAKPIKVVKPVIIDLAAIPDHVWDDTPKAAVVIELPTVCAVPENVGENVGDKVVESVSAEVIEEVTEKVVEEEVVVPKKRKYKKRKKSRKLTKNKLNVEERDDEKQE